jgi:hypothetical protein
MRTVGCRIDLSSRNAHMLFRDCQPHRSNCGRRPAMRTQSPLLFRLQLRQGILYPRCQWRVRRLLQICFVLLDDFIIMAFSGERLGHDQVRNCKLLVVFKRWHFASIGKSKVRFTVLQLSKKRKTWTCSTALRCAVHTRCTKQLAKLFVITM